MSKGDKFRALVDSVRELDACVLASCTPPPGVNKGVKLEDLDKCPGGACDGCGAACCWDNRAQNAIESVRKYLNRGESTWSQAITEWQAATFGNPTPAAALRRADQEWGELRYQPSPEEAADVVICLAAYVKACGGDLAAAVADKLAVCKTRTWVQDADGSWRHV